MTIGIGPSSYIHLIAGFGEAAVHHVELVIGLWQTPVPPATCTPYGSSRPTGLRVAVQRASRRLFPKLNPAAGPVKLILGSEAASGTRAQHGA